MHSDKLTLAQRVKWLRRENGWNQQQLANRAGLHQSTVSLIEAGKRVDVPLRTLLAFCKAFKCNLEVFLPWRKDVKHNTANGQCLEKHTAVPQGE